MVEKLGYKFVPFWRMRDRFTPAIAFKEKLFDKVAQKTIDCSKVLGNSKKMWFQGFILLILLSYKDEPSKKFIVATVHFFSQPVFDHVKQAQALLLLQSLSAFMIS